MILAFLIINKQGKPRLVRFYDGSGSERQQYLMRTLHGIVVECHESKHSNIIDGTAYFGINTRIIFRSFTTLYFILVHDENESEVAMLDLIQVFVKTLNHCFENVCELDIIFNFDKVNYVLDNLIIGGLVTSLNVKALYQNSVETRIVPSHQPKNAAESLFSHLKDITLL